MSCSLVILGAGLPHHGKWPTVLREPHSGISTLQWVLDATGCTIDAVTFVAGYQADSIRVCYPKLKVIENTLAAALPCWHHHLLPMSLCSFATAISFFVLKSLKHWRGPMLTLLSHGIAFGKRATHAVRQRI